MNLHDSPAHQAFRAEVRAFLEDQRDLAPGAGEWVPSGSSADKLRAWQVLLIERGYAARTVPKEYGGFGAEPDLLKRIVLDEEFNRARVSSGISGQGPDMLVPTLLEHGTEEQKRHYVPKTLHGEFVWCQGYSEPNAGSDLANVQTRAVIDGDDFVINGQKIWTTTAHLSNMMFALVRTDPDARKLAGLSYLLVPMDSPGLDARPLRTMTGHGEFNEVFFTDVRVPRANVVGQCGEGWKIANTTLRHERNLLASSAGLERSLKRLIELMTHEQTDGARAIDSPVWCDRLVRLQSQALAMRCHSMRMLTGNLRGEHPGTAGLVAKLVGCELSHQINALALDVLGELGTLYDGSKHERAGGQWQTQYMFSLGLIIGGGTAQIQKNIISERGLGLPREPKPAAAAG